MKKILLMVMMLTISVIGTAAKKTVNKTFEGQYTKSTNTFTYVKDNLVFPNKVITYTVKDDSGLLDQIYNFISEKYGVTDTDIIVLNVNGTISNKTGLVTIKKINNYQVPEDRLHASEYETPASTNSSNNENTVNDDASNLNNTGNQETGN